MLLLPDWWAMNAGMAAKTRFGSCWRQAVLKKFTMLRCFMNGSPLAFKARRAVLYALTRSAIVGRVLTSLWWLSARNSGIVGGKVTGFWALNGILGCQLNGEPVISPDLCQRFSKLLCSAGSLIKRVRLSLGQMPYMICLPTMNAKSSVGWVSATSTCTPSNLELSLR